MAAVSLQTSLLFAAMFSFHIAASRLILPAEAASATCSSEEMRCNDSKCIPKAWVCDTERDCSQGEDEITDLCQNRTCEDGQYRCNTGLCIIGTWKCDGAADCEDGEDEKNCATGWRDCKDDEFSCANGNCIAARWRCDRDADCSDGSDEEGCEAVTCSADEFLCHNDSRCIINRWKCDGDADCDDKSDEFGCPTPTQHSYCKEFEFTCGNGDCLHQNWKCDGDDDCMDGTDETDCAGRTCRGDEFLCSDGTCIGGYLQCNGRSECSDGSDETGCSQPPTKCKDSEFDCSGDGSHCILLAKLCDRQPDCEKGEDEGTKVCQHIVDPCLTNNGGCNHKCNYHYSGHATCSCNAGYQLANNSKTCHDINECAIPGTCSQICINLPGSYKCECNKGYSLDFRDPYVSPVSASSHTTLVREKLRYCRASGPAPHLLFSNRHEVRRIQLETRDYVAVVRDLSDAGAVDFDVNDNTVFWADYSMEQIFFTKVNAPAGNQESLATGNILIPDGLAYDWIHKNVYWTDTGTDTIEMVSIDGDRWRVVLIKEGLDEPRAIVVDPRHEQGWMYWTDWGNKPKIARAGLDGSAIATIVDTDILWPNGLTIDYVDNRLYWIDVKLNLISSSDFTGHDRRVVLKSQEEIKHPYAITVFEDYLYWSDWKTESIRRTNKFHGGDISNVILGLRSPLDVHIFHPMRQPNATNRCENHQCSHICLPSPRLTDRSSLYRCLCPIGFKPHTTDTNTCVNTTFTTPAITTTTTTTKTTARTTQHLAVSTTEANPSKKQAAHDTGEQQNVGRVAGIVAGVISVLIIIVFVIGFMVYRSYAGKGVHGMKFDNPVYRKTTEDHVSLEKHQYQPSNNLPSTLEPLTSSHNELV